MGIPQNLTCFLVWIFAYRNDSFIRSFRKVLVHFFTFHLNKKFIRVNEVDSKLSCSLFIALCRLFILLWYFDQITFKRTRIFRQKGCTRNSYILNWNYKLFLKIRENVREKFVFVSNIIFSLFWLCPNINSSHTRHIQYLCTVEAYG